MRNKFFELVKASWKPLTTSILVGPPAVAGRVL